VQGRIERYGAPDGLGSEQQRQALNNWIRTGKAHDAVIDFDQATRDPSDRKKFLAVYDSCDHLHPNDAGYKVVADAIDLVLFSPGPATMATSAM
jgi:lysophospholipase L1-like esterase